MLTFGVLPVVAVVVQRGGQWSVLPPNIPNTLDLQVAPGIALTPSPRFAAAGSTAVTFMTGQLTGLIPGVRYYFRLHPGDGAYSSGEGSFSNSICFDLGGTNLTGILEAASPLTYGYGWSTTPLTAAYSSPGSVTAVLSVYAADQCWYSQDSPFVAPAAQGTATFQVGHPNNFL